MARPILVAAAAIWILAVSACDSEEMREVEIPAEMQVCATDAQCRVVEIGCASCCQYQAVNEGLLAEFDRMYRETCRDYSGPVCDCVPPGRPVGKCEQLRCTVIYEPFSQ